MFIFHPCLRQGSPLRTAISPPSPSTCCPLDSTHNPSFPLHLLGRHVFKVCPESEGGISLSVAFIDSFQDTEDLSPLNPAPSQPANSPHLPPSQISALGKSPSLHLLVTVTHLTPWWSESPHPLPLFLPPAFLCALNVPFSPSPASTCPHPSAHPLCAKFGKPSHENLNNQIPVNLSL